MEYKIVTTTKGFFTFENLVDKDNNPIAVVVNRKAMQNLLDTNIELLEALEYVLEAYNKFNIFTDQDMFNTQLCVVKAKEVLNKAKGE